MPPKYASGYQKRKKKEKEAALMQSQPGDINKYFKKRRETQENVENVVNHRTRFEHFKLYAETFGFLFDVQKLRSMSSPELLKCCMNLEKYLTHDRHSDIDGDELHSELMVWRICLPNEVKRAIEVLQYMKTSLNGIFQHTYVAYQILLTVPVTVASAERNFSKLKLIKTYLRSTMSQERLNGLAMLSIEKEMAETLDCEHLINVFASKNARRTIFK